ncbi:hypothetical protein [Streptococcus pyogenes]|nr:hypothetical protein [Streptococcus pyogenes]
MEIHTPNQTFLETKDQLVKKYHTRHEDEEIQEKCHLKQDGGSVYQSRK